MLRTGGGMSTIHETEQRKKLPMKKQLKMFDIWTDNSIPSPDGRNEVHLSKKAYVRKSKMP